MAKFYGIGTGPGDSSLLTVKAVETLKNLDILYTPEAKKGGESLALSIVSKYLPEELEIKSRHFPMNFNDGEKILAWNQVADEIVEDVKEGKNVLVCAHQSSLRALVKYIEGISDEGIREIRFSTGELAIYEPLEDKLVRKNSQLSPEKRRNI